MATASQYEPRIPPHDLDAEQSVLGAILLDPVAITRVLDQLRPEDFYRENHRQIYRAAQNLFAGGEPIDNVTLSAELEKLGVLDRIGGRAHLALLQQSVPTAANVEHYARIVKDKAYKRSLISAGGDITGYGYDDSVDGDEALNMAQSTVYAIAADRVGADIVRLDRLLRPAMDRIDALMTSGRSVLGVPSGFFDLDAITNGFKGSDLIIIAGRPSMGKCLSSTTLIDNPLTGDRQTIEQAVRERLPRVMGISDSGAVRVATVSDWVDSGIQECFRVRTRTGRAVEVTGHHPFLTPDGWQPLHDIRLGDQIGVPRRVPCFGADASLGLDQVRLLAYCISEAGLTERWPSFVDTDPDILQDFRRILALRFPGFEAGGSARPSLLRAWLESMGLCSKDAFDKRFPACVWRWDRERLAVFLRCLMSCDGSLRERGGMTRIEFSAASRELADDIQHALTRLGVVSRLWCPRGGGWRGEISEAVSVETYQREIGWIGAKARRLPPRQVSAPGGDLGRLPAGVSPSVSSSRLEGGLTMVAVASATAALAESERERILHPDLYWDEVVSIEPVGRLQVYDLSVPEGANFIAQDVVVHNTSLALNIALQVAIHEKVGVAIFSLEMSQEQLVERMLCEEARIDAMRMHRGMLGDAEYDRLARALGPLGEAPIFIDESPTMDELTLLMKARRAKLQENIGMVIIDYLQLMHSRRRGDDANRVQEVSQISRSLKALARELKIPVLAISQLSRAPEQRPDKKPMLSDLRESGSIEQDADLVLFVFRPEYYKPEEKPGIAEIIVAKNRNGPTGTIDLAFRRELTRFENLDKRREPPSTGPAS